nr:hypothetical protein [Acidobacteriota bacterium]
SIDNVSMSASGTANGISLVNHGGALSVTSSLISANSSGTAVLIDGGSTGLVFTNTPVGQNGGRVVDIQNRTGGTVSFNGSSTVTGTNGAIDAVVLLNNTGGSIVTFAAAVQLNTNAAGARGLVADSAGVFTLNMTSGGSAVSSTGGAAIDIEDINVNVNVATTFSTGSNGNGVRVENISGSAAFGNTAVNTSAGTGVMLTNNAASITFSDLDIAPASGQRAVHATSNSGTISSASGTVAAVDAIAVEIVGASSASRTPLNMTLTSVSATALSGNPPNGIVLTNTNGPGASVGFVVNGDGTDTTLGGNASGGTISSTVGADGATGGIGVRLDNADEVTLRRMQINDHPNFAVRGTNVANFNLEYSTVNGVNGTSSASDEGSVAFNELTGSSGVISSVVRGAVEDTFRVVNTAGTLDRITFDNFTLGPMNAATGDNGVFIQARNSAVIKATVQNSNLTSARGDMLQFDLANTGTGELIFKDNTVNNQHPAVVPGGGGIILSGGGSPTAAPTFTYDFEGNTFRGARGAALLVLMLVGSGSATGRIENNTFGVSGIDRSCSSEATCIDIRSEGRAAQTVLVDNNQIRQYSTNAGIYFEFDGINQGGSLGTIGALNATVTNNIIEQPSTAPGAKGGVHVNFGAASTDTYQGCADIRNLTAANSGSTDASTGSDYLVRQRALTTMRLPGYAGANNVNASVIAFIQAQNFGTETVFVQNTVATGGGGFVGGGACLQPADLASFDAPDAGNSFTELAATSSDVNPLADAQQTAQSGFAAGDEFAAASKIRRGFANSERGQ